MAETDPGLPGGNILLRSELKLGKLSDALTPEEAEDIRDELEAAKARLDDAAKESSESLIPSAVAYLDITEHTAAIEAGPTQVAGVPATVGYVSKRRETHYGIGVGELNVYDRTENLGSVLSVVLDFGAAEPEELMFDFDTPDPVEEVARLGHALTTNEYPVDPQIGAYIVLQIIDEASRAAANS